MIDGRQVIPASNNPLNVTYNRDFISRIDQSLGNAIFNTANSMGYRFAPLQGFPNEAQQQDLVNALHVLDQYKTPIRISEHQFIPIIVQHHSEIQQQQPLPSFTDTFLESNTGQNMVQQSQPTVNEAAQSSQQPTFNSGETAVRNWANMADSITVHPPPKQTEAEIEDSTSKKAKKSKRQDTDPETGIRTSKREKRPVDRLQVSNLEGEEDEQQHEEPAAKKSKKKHKKHNKSKEY